MWPWARQLIKFADWVRHLKGVGYDDTFTLEIFDHGRQMLVRCRKQIKAMFAMG